MEEIAWVVTVFPFQVQPKIFKIKNKEGASTWLSGSRRFRLWAVLP
jgi:hypothetical protein